MSKDIPLGNLLSKKQDGLNTSSEMLYGTYGVWHVGPQRNSKEKKQEIVATKPHENAEHISLSKEEKWFYMVPLMKEMWQQREKNSQGSPEDMKQWKGRLGNHGMDPKKFQMIAKMHKVREERSKDNTSGSNSSDSPFPHKHGFCKRFSGVRKDGKENHLFGPKNLNIFHQV